MSETIDDGGNAFPNGSIDGRRAMSGGMTLRDYFAAHAPEMPPGWTGVVDDAERMSRPDDKLYRLIEWRWFYADAMLAARKVK